MRIFNTSGTKFFEITEEVFPLERDMQRLAESNLQQIFGLELVRSEFELHGLRIDTLAFDRESKAFVIIEYKKDRNFSVVDQGVAYLNLMLNNKADFILEYNEKSTQSLKRIDVDWSQSRVIFISPEFTKYQQHAIGFKDFAIQLWEIHRYKNGLVIFDEVKPLTTKESITTIAKSSSAAKKVSQEIRVYTEDDHLKIADDTTKELYTDLKSGILRLGKDIEVRPRKYYVAFRRNQGFVSFVFLKAKLKAYLNIQLSELHDPMKKARDVKGIGHYSHGDTELTVTHLNEIPYILTLVKQAYERS